MIDTPTRRIVLGAGAFAAGSHVEHGHVLGRALVHVAVAGQQQRPPARLGLGAGVGPEQVVGLEVLADRDRPAEGGEELEIGRAHV